MKKILIDDGFQPELVYDASFEGLLQIPILESPKELIVPKNLIPFSERRKTEDKETTMVMFYEHDSRFGEVVHSPQCYISELKEFMGVISPDNSLFFDSPLCVHLMNTYRNRVIGYTLQKAGIYVVPNIRWSDERSYTRKVFPELFPFLGVPKNSIVAISSYGALKDKETRFHFEAGLEVMLDEVKPKIVLVYGAMPLTIFEKYTSFTIFINYPNFIKQKHLISKEKI